MTKLSQHQSNEYTKMMVIGNPGSGKTGGLASLVKAGYWLGILDLDNGLETLKQYVLREAPDKIDNIEYRTLRDEARMTPAGRTVIGAAKAYQTAVDMCDKWKYGDIDEGHPWQWGPKRVLVIDSGTFLAQAGYDWCQQVVVKPGKEGKYDQRAVFYAAQQSFMNLMSIITAENFKTNVIVNTHIRYIEDANGVMKGFPNTIGTAIATMVGAYFNSIALCETQHGGKHTIVTASTSHVDLKNPAPFAMQPRYPLETGLADFFKVLRQPVKEVPPTPKPVQQRLFPNVRPNLRKV
jgi:hypothetical protein